MKKLCSFLSFLFIFPLVSCNMLNLYEIYEDDEKYHVLNESGETYNSSLKDIDISWVKGSIKITGGDDRYEGISVFEQTSETFDEKLLCHVYRDEDFLKIKYCKSGASMLEGVKKDLIIYVPYNVQIGSLSINNVSSDVLISNIYCDSIKINNVSGNVSLDNINVPTINYDGTSGTFSATVSSSTKEIYVDQVSGNTILALNENIEGFVLEFDSISGNVNEEFFTKKEDDTYIYLNKDDCLKAYVSSVSGNVSILTYRVEE